MPFAWAALGPRLRRVVATAPGSSKIPSASVSRSRRKTSSTSLVSSATRLVAVEEKTTKRPSALIEGSRLGPLASTPAVETLMRVTWATAGAAAARQNANATRTGNIAAPLQGVEAGGRRGYSRPVWRCKA